MRLEQAEEQYNKEGEPDISPSHEVWECADAGCRFTCTKNMTMHSFCGVSQLVVLQWIVRHELIDTDCAVKDCDGTVRVISTIHWSSTGSQQVSYTVSYATLWRKEDAEAFLVMVSWG